MSLWPGYYMGKIETIPAPILTEIPIIHMDAEMEPVSEVKSKSGTYYLFGKAGALLTANGFILMEQFGAGDTLTWMYPVDEFHLILKGKAEVTYSLASTDNTEKKTMDIEEGDFFVTPRGSIVEFKIDPRNPLRRICGLMPGNALNPVQMASLSKEKE